MIAGERPDIIEVGVWGWGGGAVDQGSKTRIGRLLGIQIAPLVTKVRVRGYGVSLGLKSNGQSVAQRDANKVFGEGKVKVVACRDLRQSGLSRPVYDISLIGMYHNGREHAATGTYITSAHVQPQLPSTALLGKTPHRPHRRGVHPQQRIPKWTTWQTPKSQTRSSYMEAEHSHVWRHTPESRAGQLHKCQLHLIAHAL